MVFLMASGFNNRGKAGDEKNASRAALVVHSLSAGGQYLISLLGPTAWVISSWEVRRLIIRSGKRDRSEKRKAGQEAESGTGPILAPPTSERSSPGRGILISAHPSSRKTGQVQYC